MSFIEFEKRDNVYAIYDWYDGIRSGVASYGNQLCYFEGQYADFNTDEKGLYYAHEWYKLSIVPLNLLEPVLEKQQLWKKYAAASKAGLIGPENHPYLSIDQRRGKQLDEVLDVALVINEMDCKIVQAKFVAVDAMVYEAGIIEYAVMWTTLLMPPSPSNKMDYGL